MLVSLLFLLSFESSNHTRISKEIICPFKQLFNIRLVMLIAFGKEEIYDDNIRISPEN